MSVVLVGTESQALLILLHFVVYNHNQRNANCLLQGSGNEKFTLSSSTVMGPWTREPSSEA